MSSGWVQLLSPLARPKIWLLEVKVQMIGSSGVEKPESIHGRGWLEVKACIADG